MSPLESEKLMTPASALSDLEWAGFYADDIGFKKLEEMIENDNLSGVHYYVALLRIATGKEPQYVTDVYDKVRKEYHLPPKSDNWDK